MTVTTEAPVVDTARLHAVEAVLLHALRGHLFDERDPHLGLLPHLQILIDAERALSGATRTRRIRQLDAARMYLERAGHEQSLDLGCRAAYAALEAAITEGVGA